jgi:hypothetical protein
MIALEVTGSSNWLRWVGNSVEVHSGHSASLCFRSMCSRNIVCWDLAYRAIGSSPFFLRALLIEGRYVEALSNGLFDDAPGDHREIMKVIIGVTCTSGHCSDRVA